MYCPSCGRETPDASQFCSSCGAYLTPAPAGVSTGGAAPPPPAVGVPQRTPASAAAPYAGFWVRFLAYFIDAILLNAAAFILFLPVAMILGVASVGVGRMGEDILGGLITLAWFPVSIVIAWLYEAMFTSSVRQATPGKMALSIIVTDERGARISFGRATGRYFGKILSGMIFFIGYLVQPFTEKRQALHDMLAQTLVVRRQPGAYQPAQY